MPKLTEATRDRRRAQIAEAAIRRFALTGLAATSMADIIEEANLSAGSIYSHFDSKAELVRFASATMLDARLSALQQEVEAATDALAPGQVLELILQDAIESQSRAQVLLQIWAEVQRDPGLADIAADNIRRVRAVALAAIRSWAESQATATPSLAKDLADALIANVHGYIVRIACDPDADPRKLLASLARGLASGQS